MMADGIIVISPVPAWEFYHGGQGQAAYAVASHVFSFVRII
ncbi:hypothetical protein [Pelotomaculum propionicicum]|nr:hypothetical protein [Pelotomaculum propionicicum]